MRIPAEEDAMRKRLNTDGYLFSRKALVKLMIPLLIEQFLTLAVGLADSIMVASVGEAAVSAVSLIDTVMVLLINVFAALAAGGAIVAGQALGHKDNEKGCEATEQLFLISFIFSIIVMVVVYAAKWFILNIVFGKIDADVMSNSNTYLQIVAGSIPFLAIYNAGAAIYRGMGNSRTPMLTSLGMNLINIGGNAILLYGLKLGIEGAAIPTLISRIFAGIFMLFILKKKSNVLHLRKIFTIRPNKVMIKKILHIGVPYGLENSMFQLGKIILLSLVSGFGTASIAANAVANNVCAFSILAGFSANYALSAICAQCVGAGDYEQVRYYTRKMMLVSYVGTLIVNIVIVALLPVIISVYKLSAETAVYARNIIFCHSVVATLIWTPAFGLPCTLRASNDVNYAMIVSIVSMWVFRIGLSYLFALPLKLGVYGVWIAMFVDWVVRAIFFIIRYRGTRWQKLGRAAIQESPTVENNIDVI